MARGADFVLEEILKTLRGIGGFTSSLTLAPSTTHIGYVGEQVFSSLGTFTRPGDTAPYAALDAVMNSTSNPTAIDFPNVVSAAGGSATIVAAKLCKSTNVVTNANFRMWLYSDTPASLPNDNAAWAQVWANRALRLGWIDFTNPVVGTDCVTYSGVLCNNGVLPCIVAGTSLRGILQALSAYVPGNAEVFDCRLRGFTE
jgi:hypothetical protein